MDHKPTGAPIRGRPADPRKHTQILDAATRLFMKEGVQGTTMEQIARDADVSKLTLYRRYPDKNTLFTEVISSKCSQYMPEGIFDVTADTDPATALTRVGSALMQLITSQDAVNLNRVIMSESAHNPAITAQFDRSGPQRIKSGMLQMMTTLKVHGLPLGDPAIAADMFSALIVGSDLNKRCAMHISPAPTEDQIHTYVKQAVAFFLSACH